MTYQPGTIVHRVDPIMNQVRLVVIRHHGDRVLAEPVGGGKRVEVPSSLLVVEGDSEDSFKHSMRVIK